MTPIVRAHTTISVDGYIAGPDHDMDWIFDRDPGAPVPAADAVIEATGSILMGRNAYDVGEASERPETQEAFGGRWNGPQFVLTHRAKPDDDITALSGDIGAAVDVALEAAGGKDVLVLGGQVARQCLEAGRLDEILVHQIPVILGGGIPFFAPGARIELRVAESSQDGQWMTIRYVPSEK
jgi:dihydrofolate reductase